MTNYTLHVYAGTVNPVDNYITTYHITAATEYKAVHACVKLIEKYTDNTYTIECSANNKPSTSYIVEFERTVRTSIRIKPE